MGNKDGKNLQYAGISSKNKMTSQSSESDLRISPKGANIPGHYRECGEDSCSRLIPCPHVRCQEHRTDMAIKNWVVEHIEP